MLLLISDFWKVRIATFAAVAAMCLPLGADESGIKLNGSGTIDTLAEGALPFVFKGTASHLGTYTAYGEVEFAAGEQAGALVGAGVAVFRAANGDLLVGVTTWDIGADGNGQVHFSWRDSIELGGAVVFSTGRFADKRPPGLLTNTSFRVNVLTFSSNATGKG